MMDHLIDDIDKKIMQLLQQNARMPISQISKQIAMSPLRLKKE